MSCPKFNKRHSEDTLVFRAESNENRIAACCGRTAECPFRIAFSWGVKRRDCFLLQEFHTHSPDCPVHDASQREQRKATHAYSAVQLAPTLYAHMRDGGLKVSEFEVKATLSTYLRTQPTSDFCNEVRAEARTQAPCEGR